MKRYLAILLTILSMTAILPFTVLAEFENSHKNTGDYITDLTEVALTQTGYSDAEYKKYGEGDNPDLLFLRWCATQARIPREVIPSTNTVKELYNFYSEGMMLNSNPENIPDAGDIMFIGLDDTPSQCAIVIGADDEYITAVICESDRVVRKKLYTTGIEKIIAFATPDYSYVSDYSTGQHMTTASFLNFRTEPNTNSKIIDKIPIGTIVDIEEVADGWGLIEYNGKKGWISMDYAILYDENHTDSSEYGVIWNVIDISKWQGAIDWNKVADGNLNAVIIRIGLRGSVSREILIDEKLIEYYNGAKAQGLHVGCYFYSTATNDEEAIEEAQFVIETIKKYNLELDMPVYMDMEDRVTERCGQTAIFSMTYAFLNEMDKAGIYSGVYCSTSWATDYYNKALFSNHALWIADWRDKCGYEGEYGMWQYSEKGSISGIESKYTDLNICYINYPQLIKDLKSEGSEDENIKDEPTTPPVTDKPTYNEPVSEETSSVEPDTEKPSYDEPISDEWASDENAENAPESESNSADKPVYDVIAGDVNGDNKITAADSRFALRISARLSTPTDVQLYAADINNDSKVTAADARKILRISAKLEN